MSYVPAGLWNLKHTSVKGIPATWRGKRVPDEKKTGPGQSRKPADSAKKISRFTGKRKMAQRRYRKKYRRRGKKRVFIPQTLADKRKLVRFKAVNYLDLSSTSGALASRIVDLLDITDPFGASGTGQPLGYDQWKALYNKAVVVGVKITMRIHNGATVGVMCGITPFSRNVSNAALSDYEYYMELPRTKARILSPDMDHCVVTSKISSRKLFGVRKLMDETTLHCLDLSTETAPSDTAYAHCWVQPLDQTSTIASGLQMILTAEYIVLLYDQVVPARSVET